MTMKQLRALQSKQVTAENRLETARAKRDALASQVRTAKNRAQRTQNPRDQKHFETLSSRLDTARERVSVLRSEASARTREAKKAAEQIVRSRMSEQTFRETHIFASTARNTQSYSDMVSQSFAGSLSPYKEKQLAKDALAKIRRRMTELRNAMKEYFGVSSVADLPDDIPYSDALNAYEVGVMRSGKGIDLDNPVDRQRVLLFAMQLFEKNDYEQATASDYVSLLGDTDNFIEELRVSGVSVNADYVMGESPETDAFYRVLNLVRKFLPDHVEESEVIAYIKEQTIEQGKTDVLSIFKDIQRLVKDREKYVSDMNAKEQRARAKQNALIAIKERAAEKKKRHEEAKTLTKKLQEQAKARERELKGLKPIKHRKKKK